MSAPARQFATAAAEFRFRLSIAAHAQEGWSSNEADDGDKLNPAAEEDVEAQLGVDLKDTEGQLLQTTAHTQQHQVDDMRAGEPSVCGSASSAGGRQAENNQACRNGPSRKPTGKPGGPMLQGSPGAVRQIISAADDYRKHFSEGLGGAWVADPGCDPGLHQSQGAWSCNM